MDARLQRPVYLRKFFTVIVPYKRLVLPISHFIFCELGEVIYM
jgi:hypothetical protein